jgi:threonine/homoserine/homoserine lactone efflux protein
MGWIFAAVALAVAGLVVLGFLGVRVLRATTKLGLEVNRTRERLESAQTLFGQKTGTIQGPKG